MIRMMVLSARDYMNSPEHLYTVRYKSENDIDPDGFAPLRDLLQKKELSNHAPTQEDISEVCSGKGSGLGTIGPNTKNVDGEAHLCAHPDA